MEMVMILRKIRLSILMVVMVLLVSSIPVYAKDSKDSKSNQMYGLKVVDTKVKETVTDSGTLTVTTHELQGNADDLQRIIADLESEGEKIIKKPVNDPDAIQTSGFVYGNATYAGGKCDTSKTVVQACTNSEVTIGFTSLGTFGVSTSGFSTGWMSKYGGYAPTSMQTRGRIKVNAYGLSGSDSILVGTYDYKGDYSTASNNISSATHNIDESEPGVFVYLSMQAGADFKWTYGTSQSYTVWSPMTEQ